MKLNRFLTVAEIILAFSGIMDLILWFTINYHIPSFTVTFFTASTIMLIEVIKYLIRKR